MTIALVASGSIAGNIHGGTSSGIDTTGASLLVMTTASYHGVIPPTPSDSKGNTWQLLIGESPGSSDSNACIWYAINPIVGTGHTFTFSSGGSIFAVTQITAWSGTANLIPFSNGTYSISNSTTTTPGSITPAQNNSLVITAYAGNSAATSASTISGGFTISGQSSPAASTNVGGGQAYLIQTTAAAANPTWTVGATCQLSSVIAVFAPAFTPSGTPALISSAAIGGNWTAAGGTSTRIDTTGATLLVMSVATVGNTTVPTPSDSYGNTWTLAKSVSPTLHNFDGINAIYYVVNPTVGSGHTFTFSGSTTYSSATITTWSGVNAIDVTNGANLTASATAQPGSVTPTTNNSLIIASYAVNGTSPQGAGTINNSFVALPNQPAIASINIASGQAYLLQATASAVNPIWTFVASGEAANTIAVFKNSNPWRQLMMPFGLI